MHSPLRFVLPFLLLFVSGCAVLDGAGQDAQERRRMETDSLRRTIAVLNDEVQVLRDSLQFIDDVDSGQYYRDRRSLLDRIERLEYDKGLLKDGGTPVATFSSDEIFKVGTSDLSEAGEARLKELVRTLTTAHSGKRVRVEAHTDNVPVGATLKLRYASNWELSGARAASVARYLTSDLKLEPNRVDAVGLGASRPAAVNNTEAGRKANRRVVVRVLPD